MTKSISGRTVLTCLLGSPVAHSISPAMHNESFRQLGLDYAYLAFDVDTTNLKTAVEGLKVMGARGFNLTMPDKNKMCEYCDRLSPQSQMIGAVNTVVIENGELYGTTTDGIGYMKAALDAGYDLRGKVMTLLGGGGAGLAICVQAAMDGLKEIRVFNIKDKFYERLERVTKEISSRTDCIVTLHDLADEEALKKSIKESDILTNSTSVGMAPNTDSCLIKDPSVLTPPLIVSDVIYNPEETKLLKMARENGCETFNGLYMLLYQGAASFKLWTGMDMPVDIVKEKYFKREKTSAGKGKHVFLVGFMGVGKSTIAACLKDKLGYAIAETDKMIEEQEGMKITEIFDTKGEPYFRQLETDLLKQLKDDPEPKIISCGGGMAMKDENAVLMKEAGTVILLTALPETILERVKDDDNRPLLRGHKDTAYIAQLMEKRRPKYEAAADVQVKTDGRSVDQICEEIGASVE